MVQFKKPYKLVIVDDEIDIAEYISYIIEKNYPKESLDISIFETVDSALEFIKKNDVKIVISDLNMPGLQNDCFPDLCHKLQKGIKVITATGDLSKKLALTRLQRGDIGFITKPFEEAEIKMYCDIAITSWDAWSKKMNNLF